MILKLHKTLPTLLPAKKILFIDYSEWDYDTINKRALGGQKQQCIIYQMYYLRNMMLA